MKIVRSMLFQSDRGIGALFSSSIVKSSFLCIYYGRTLDLRASIYIYERATTGQCHTTWLSGTQQRRAIHTSIAILTAATVLAEISESFKRMAAYLVWVLRPC